MSIEDNVIRMLGLELNSVNHNRSEVDLIT